MSKAHTLTRVCCLAGLHKCPGWASLGALLLMPAAFSVTDNMFMWMCSLVVCMRCPSFCISVHLPVPLSDPCFRAVCCSVAQSCLLFAIPRTSACQASLSFTAKPFCFFFFFSAKLNSQTNWREERGALVCIAL